MHRSRTRRWLVPAALVAAIVVALALGAAFAYARSQRDVIAQGVRVDSIPLGGLEPDAARVRLEHAFQPLERPLVLRYPGGQLVLTARETKIAAEIDGLVARALDLSRGDWFGPSAWRGLTGEILDVNLRPHPSYSRSAVERAVQALRKRVDSPAVNAAVHPSFDRLRVEQGRAGARVSASLLRHEIEHALVSRTAPRLIDVPIRRLSPAVTVAALSRRYPSFITIDRGAFKLRVYNHLGLARAYSIAVGQAGLQTPAGLYHIQDKVVNPSWQVPFSSWTGSLAGRLIPPGPDDPLKARWMGIFNGAGIHGTDETWSIGHAVSHGCVRMTIPDVIDLFDRVSVGTPVYIGD